MNAHEVQGGSRYLWVPLVCLWLLMVCTFSVPGREGPKSTGALDPIALVKLATRLGSLALFSGFLLLFQHTPRGREVLVRLVPFGVYVGWAITSALWSPLPAVSLGQSMSLLVLLLLTGIIALLWRDMRDTSRVLAHLAAGCLLMSSVALAAHLLAPDELGLNRGELVEEGDTGIVHPSTASATAALGLLLVVGSFLFWDWRWPRALLGPASVVHAGVLFLAASRTAVAVVAVLLVLAFVIAVARSSQNVAQTGSGAGLIACVLVLSLAGAAYLIVDPNFEWGDRGYETVAEYMRRDASDESLSSFSGRADLWEIIWADFLASPLRGNGYFVTSSTGSIDVWGEDVNLTAHNLLLQVLASTGLIGCTIFLTALGFWAFFITSKLQYREDTAGTLPLLALVCLWNMGWGQLSEGFMGALYPEALVFFAVVGIGLGSSLAAAQQPAMNPATRASQSQPELQTIG